MPSDTALNALQAALFTLLKADGQLTTDAPGGVLDFVPEAARQEPYPAFITVGDDDEISWNTFQRVGRDVSVNLHIWSQAEGWKEATTILGDLVRLLDYPPAGLTVAGWPTTAFSYYEGAQKLRDPDGITRHIVARFRVRLEQ